VGLAFINGKSREVWEKGGMDGWMDGIAREPRA
jgi:hypothetical protein